MWRLCVLWLAGCSFSHGQWQPVGDDDADAQQVVADAAPPDAPSSFVLRVQAWVDGRSRLTFHGTTVQWEHFQFAAPGREAGVNIATKLGEVDWFPMWPDVPTAENRDCNCKSSVYTDLPVGIPRAPSTTTLTAVMSRKPPTVIQEPAEANDYTLVVELSDLGFGGSATNIVDLAVNVVH
ncbi:MAG: hypothetical protein HOV81_40975 [Kofleriaceae bacterium]|nr:hypothetical protein [Kofleriaceae bacterium]